MTSKRSLLGNRSKKPWKIALPRWAAVWSTVSIQSR
jgi:hypothetical protein